MNDMIYILIYKNKNGVTVLGAYTDENVAINITKIVVKSRIATLEKEDAAISFTKDDNIVYGEKLVNGNEEWLVFKTDLMYDVR